uniref:Uncharacterized protein n=1 Tax=Haslea nusantara TaxID=2600302 RepID=A0A5B8HVL5_9STRA|nr:hypothetical protein [Haslea nusantara]QDX17608.1 hypothetical protein [Haslea nusantara]
MQNKSTYIQQKLKIAHFNLTKRTLQYIKDSHHKHIPLREDPELFISLIESDQAKDNKILRKILLKVKSRSYIENFTFNNEVFNLVTIPFLCTTKAHFTCLHMETHDSSLRETILDYFRYTEEEITDYLLISGQALDLTSLLEENKQNMIKKIKSLKYSKNADLYYMRKGIQSANLNKNKIGLETKHLFLTVQLILLKNTLYSETYKEIYFFRNLLIDFLFLSKLVT